MSDEGALIHRHLIARDYTLDSIGEQGLDFLLDYLPLVVWVTDRDLRVVEVRGLLSARIGFDLKTLFEIFHTDDPTATPIAETIAALAGESSHFEFVWNETNLLCGVRPVVLPTSEIHCTMSFALDVSAQRLLSEQLLSAEQRYRDLFDRSQDTILTMDLEGRVRTVNLAGVRLTGFSREELMRLTFYELVGPASRVDALNLMREMLGGAIEHDISLPLLMKTGSLVQVKVHTRLLFNAGVPAAIQATIRVIGTPATSD